MKFKLDDRVRVIGGALGRFKGECVAEPGYVHVLLDGRGLTIVIAIADLEKVNA